jgi:hypothetical protein
MADGIAAVKKLVLCHLQRDVRMGRSARRRIVCSSGPYGASVRCGASDGLC